VLPFVLFAIYIFELLNIGYFSIKDQKYFKGGMIAVTIQSVIIIFANVWYNHKKKKQRMEISKEDDLTLHMVDLEKYDSHGDEKELETPN
jgi:hypothetical protein